MEVLKLNNSATKRLRESKFSPTKLNFKKMRNRFELRTTKKKFRKRTRVTSLSPATRGSFFNRRVCLKRRNKRGLRMKSISPPKKQLLSPNMRNIKKVLFRDLQASDHSDESQKKTSGWNQTQLKMFDNIQEKVMQAKASRFSGFNSPLVLRDFLQNRNSLNRKNLNAMNILKSREQKQYRDAFLTMRLSDSLNRDLTNVMPKLDV